MAINNLLKTLSNCKVILMNNKVLTIILDGFGYSETIEGNAIAQANKPFLEKIWNSYPTTLINASGNACGLPEGEMGTSESGHITIGAGRIVWQPLEEINQSIESLDFFKKKQLLEYFNKEKTLHIIGMLSDGGIHSHINHLFALLKIAKEKNIEKIYIHAISDGRDVQMASIEKYLKKLEIKIKQLGVGKIASLIGRFYAMDRDNNWERTDEAFDLYTKSKGYNHQSPLSEISEIAYEKEKNDYYIKAIKLLDFQSIKKDDNIIFFNFRADRSEQLTKRFYENGYKNLLAFGPYTTDFPVLFSPKKIKGNIGEILSKNGKKQLRIAETEKYSHVTFYLNSQNHEKNQGETHLLISSPKVANYADKPEMSAFKIKDKLIEEIKSNKYDAIFVNLANPDLVGHSGILKKAIEAIEVIDKCLSEIIPSAIENGYDIIITADHGNAEKMKNEIGENCATHTTNPVRLTLISKGNHKLKGNMKKLKPSLTQYGLKDIAPTILDLMGINKDKEMSGESLIDKA